jgi:alpha-ribazole phosphatase
MQLILLRHPPVRAEGLCYGQTDVELVSGEPSKTAQALHGVLPQTIDQIYTSPLSRCRLLAEELAEQHEITIVPELMELHFGEWENKAWDDIDRPSLETWMQDFVHLAPPKGESVQTLFSRVTQFIRSLRAEKDQTCVLISHAGPIRCIIAATLEIPLQQLGKIQIQHGTPIHLTLGPTPDFDQVLFNG